MMFSSKQLPDGRWVPSKPLPGPLVCEIRERLYGAWLIISGKAHAVRWY